MGGEEGELPEEFPIRAHEITALVEESEPVLLMSLGVTERMRMSLPPG